MTIENSRRDFLLRSCSSLTAVWLSAHWPALLSAASHARNAAQSPASTKLEFFTPDQAKELDAITSRIIPTDQTPGAHEAGVVYFIDSALMTFAVDDQKTYREGFPEMQARTHELFPALDKFSAATPEQQDEILHSFDEHAAGGRRPYRPRAALTAGGYLLKARKRVQTLTMVRPKRRVRQRVLVPATEPTSKVGP